MDKPKAYIESSVVSYYTAHRSRDLIVMAHQDITHTWWEKHLSKYEVCISAVVLDEIGRGDPEAASERLQAVSGFPVLPIRPEVEHLAALYDRELQFPGKSLRDTLHIALASVHAVDYLVTWNCRHIANAHIRRGLAELNRAEGISTPIICTPEELLDDDAIPPPKL